MSHSAANYARQAASLASVHGGTEYPVAHQRSRELLSLDGRIVLPGLEVDEPEPLLLPELVSFHLSQQQPLYLPPDAHRPKRQTEGTPGREDILDWDDYFMGVARLTEERSEHPERQVGACIVNKDKKVVGVGHNRMPNSCEGKASDNPEDNKSFYVCHAELNAIMNKNSADIRGCTMYVTQFPCNECAKIIIQSGIKEVVYLDQKPYKKPGEKLKNDEQRATVKMLDVAGVTYSPNRKMTEGTPGREDILESDDFLMGVAHLAEERSEDPSTQVGACIVDKDKKVVSVGYNRMPNGCEGKLGKHEWTKASDNPEDNKSFYVCHAELNAIMNKNSADIRGCTMYVTLFPCNECAKIIIQSGITEVVYLYKKPYKKPGEKEKREKQRATEEMLKMAGVTPRHFKPERKNIEINFDEKRRNTD